MSADTRSDNHPNAPSRDAAVEPSYQQTIAHYLVRAVPTARPGQTVLEVQTLLIGRRYDDASHVFVLGHDDQLAGVVRITDLAAASPTTLVNDLIKADRLQVVRPDSDREDGASAAIRDARRVRR
jgi:magnesium transporter